MAQLKINRGTTFSFEVEYEKDGVATSLVGATIRFTVKTTEYDDSTDDSTAIISKDVTNGNDQGIATITIDPADTATLNPNDEYFYDIKVEEAGGAIYKISEGTIIFDASPTNRGV